MMWLVYSLIAFILVFVPFFIYQRASFENIKYILRKEINKVIFISLASGALIEKIIWLLKKF